MRGRILEAQDNFYLPKDAKDRYRSVLRRLSVARGSLVSKKAMYTFLVEKFLASDELQAEFVRWFEKWREHEDR